MALSGGGKEYGARAIGSNLTPATRQFEKASGDSVVIKAGFPVIVVGGAGKVISRAAVASSEISSAALLGFASHDDYSVTNTDYGGFGLTIGPKHTVGLNGAGNEAIQVHVADDLTEYCMALVSGVVAATTLVGTTAGFAFTSDTCTIKPTASVKTITITDIWPGDEGKDGGRVWFTVTSSARQWPI